MCFFLFVSGREKNVQRKKHAAQNIAQRITLGLHRRTLPPIKRSTICTPPSIMNEEQEKKYCCSFSGVLDE